MITMPEAPERSRVSTVVLMAGAMVVVGSLMSLLWGALSAWAMGSGYVVKPGRPL